MHKVSVIIPFYNVESYIAKCLQSVSQQTFRDFEVILVDDGSNDNSASICKRFTENDSRFRLYSKQNEGVAQARNFGLEKAEGDFITFIDSDDIAHPELLKIMTENACKHNAEISIVGHKIFFGDSTPKRKAHAQICIFSPEEAIENALYQKDINNAMWGKLFMKSLFDDIRFPANRIYEDLAVFYLLFERAKSIVATKDTLYFYRKREGSYIQTFTPQRTDVLDITDQLCDYMQRHHHELTSAANDRKLSANFNILWLSNIHKCQDEHLNKRCWQNIIKLRLESLANPQVRIKNKLGVLVSFLGLKATILIAKCFKA